jgi:MFS family permease
VQLLPDSLRNLWADDRARVLVFAGIFGMVALNQLGTGVLSALIPVQLAADGHRAAAAGAISTTFSLCFLVGCIFGPGIAAILGPTRTILVVAGVNAVLALLLWLFPNPFAWAVMRGVGGFVTAMYFVLIESWVASLSTRETRGLVFGFYMVIVRLAFAAGQMLIAFMPADQALQLLFVSMLAYLASPLLRPSMTGAPVAMSRPSLASFLELPRLAPAAAAAALSHGLIFSSVPGLLPKWGYDAGLNIETVAAALTVLQLGGLVFQMPLSYAADRVERRTVMALALAGSSLLAVFVMSLSPSNFWPSQSWSSQIWMWLAVVFVWGGLSSAIYSLGAAHANDLAPPEKRVAWVSSIMLIWGVGAMLGPLFASLLMDTVGAATLWIYAAAVSASVAAYLLWRKLVRR